MSDVCVCPVCMNEEHKVDIHMDGNTHLEGSLETVWGAWKVNSAGERSRIVKNLYVTTSGASFGARPQPTRDKERWHI